MLIEKPKLALYHECLKCGNEFSSDIGALCPHDGTELVPVFSDALEGTRLNEKYDIIALCGSGSTGNVYKARHIALKREVAIKFLHRPLVDDEEKVRKFEDEARALSKLEHPKIIKVIDYGLEPQPFIVMEYSHGKRLDQVLQTVGAFPYKIAVRVCLQIAEAMAFVHEKGYVHRDLKPSNIMVSKLESDCPEIKILDFGTAKLFDAQVANNNEIIGSPPYMSPEQCAGERIDARSDVYSLGCLMFEILSGQKPFKADTPQEYMYKHQHQLPDAPSKARPSLRIPEQLDRLICRALSKQVDFRVQSMRDLIKELEQISATTMASATALTEEEEKKDQLSLVYPGIIGLMALFTTTGWLANYGLLPQSGAEDIVVRYFLNMAGVIALFCGLYWIRCLAKLQTASRPTNSKRTLKEWIGLTLACPPASAALALLLTLVQLLIPNVAGYSLSMAILAAFAVLFGKYLSALYEPIAQKVAALRGTDSRLRSFWIKTSLMCCSLIPVAITPLVFRAPGVQVILILTLLMFSYLVFYCLRLEIEGKKRPTPLEIGTLLCVLPVCLFSCFSMLESKEGAMRLNYKANQLGSTDPNVFFARARIYTVRQQLALAIADYERALKYVPRSHYGWRQRGYLLSDGPLDQSDEAIKSINESLKILSYDSPLIYQHVEYDKQARFKEALELADRIAAMKTTTTNSALNFSNAGGTACRAGEFKRSVEYCTAALKLFPEDDRSLYWRAVANLNLHNVDAAKQDLAVLERTDPTSDLTNLLKAYIALEKHEWAEVMKIWEKLPTDPGDLAEAHQQKALAYMGMGNLDKARAEAESGLQKEPEADYRYRIAKSYAVLAKVLMAQKNYGLAYKCVRYAYKMAPQNEFKILKDELERLSS